MRPPAVERNVMFAFFKVTFAEVKFSTVQTASRSKGGLFFNSQRTP